MGNNIKTIPVAEEKMSRTRTEIVQMSAIIFSVKGDWQQLLCTTFPHFYFHWSILYSFVSWHYNITLASYIYNNLDRVIKKRFLKLFKIQNVSELFEELETY